MPSVELRGYSDLRKALKRFAPDLDKQLNPLMDKVIEWRHDIHQYPELSNREFRTAKKVEDHLLSLGIEIENKIAKNVKFIFDAIKK